MIPARWKTKNGKSQHRDPGCRYIRWLGLELADAIQAGHIIEMGADEATLARLPRCGSCFSQAGYKRLPRDISVDLANLDVAASRQR